VVLFLFCDLGCSYLTLQMKAIKLYLAVLTSSSHRLFIICFPHSSTYEGEVSEIQIVRIFTFICSTNKWLIKRVGTKKTNQANAVCGPYLNQVKYTR
jgi:hypothetical protein